MKTKISRISRRTVSMVLALLMMVSILGIGSLITVSAAAQYIYFDATNFNGSYNNSVYMSIVDSDNESHSANASDTSGAGSYVPKDDDTWVAFSQYKGNVWRSNDKVDLTADTSMVSFWSKDEHTYNSVWQVNCSLVNTYTSGNMFTISSGKSNHSDRQTDCFSGTWGVFDPSAQTMFCPEDVLSGTDIMFYIQGYSGFNKLGNSSKEIIGETSTKQVGSSNVSYVQIAKTDAPNYQYITNNPGNWVGNQNTSIGSSSAGKKHVAAGSTSTTNATTATTNLSSASISSGTASITLSTTCGATTSSNGAALYYLYYLDDTFVSGSEKEAKTTAESFTLDTSSLSTGEHTLKTIATDGNIYYIADTDTLVVNPASTPSIATFTIDGAESKTLNLGEEATLASSTSNAGGNTVTYSSSDSTVASVSGTTVKAKKPGSATITATLTVSGTDYTADVSVTVSTPEVSTFQYGSATNNGTTAAKAYPIYAGQTSIAPTMAVSNTNAGATVTYAYTIGDSTYGTVASDGKITAKTTLQAAPTVNATATISYNGESYTTASKTAYYKVYAYYLLGFRNTVSDPWEKNAANMMAVDSDSGWYTINRTLSGGSTTYGSGSNGNSDTGFKVCYYDGTTSTYYSNSGTVTGDITKTTLNGSDSTWVYETGVNNNARLTTKNCSTTNAVYKFYFKESTKQLGVMYPRKVTFDANGGSSTTYQAVAYGGTASAPATSPTRSGYTFLGWYNQAGTTPNDFSASITSDKTIYAKWDADSQTLNYYGAAQTASNGSYNEVAALTSAITASPASGYKTDMSVTLTAANVAGYTFVGWYSDLDGAVGHRLGTNRAYQFTMPASTKTAYALYKQGVYVTFNDSSDFESTELKGATFTYINAQPVPPADPDHESEGWRFTGWQVNGAGTVYTNAQLPQIAGNADITYVAHYDEIVSTITYGASSTTDGTSFNSASSSLVTAQTITESAGGGQQGGGGGGSTPPGGDTTYYLHIGKQNAFKTNTGIAFTYDSTNGYYWAKYENIDAYSDYPFFICTQEAATLDDWQTDYDDTVNQSVTYLDASWNPDSVINNTLTYMNNYSGYACFKIYNNTAISELYFTFTRAGDGLVVRSSLPEGGGQQGGGQQGGGQETVETATDFTTNPQDVHYGTKVRFTAEASTTISGDTYRFVGWYSSATPVDGETALGNRLTYEIDSATAASYSVYARYAKAYHITLYNTWREVENRWIYLTSPPRTVKRTSQAGTVTSYTYSKSETSGEGHVIYLNGHAYGEGNMLEVLAGDTIELKYSALSSSDVITGAFFNNDIRYSTEDEPDNSYINGRNANPNAAVERSDGSEYKPVSEGDTGDDDWDYTYLPETTLYADENYYVDTAHETTIHNNASQYKAEINQDTHTISWTAKGDYLNIDLELGGKKQILFTTDSSSSEFTTDNVEITSKHKDNYYNIKEQIATLTVAPKGSTKQTNTITIANIKYYYYDSARECYTDAAGNKVTKSNRVEIPANVITASSAGATSANSGATNGANISFSGYMPATDVLVDLKLVISYELKLDSWMRSDTVVHKTKFHQVATITAKKGSSNFQEQAQNDTAGDAVGPDSATKGEAITYSYSYHGEWGTYYMFTGWYKAKADGSGPDFANGYLNKNDVLTYYPKENTTIYAVGTRDLFINGSRYITGADTDYDSTKNYRMSFDPSLGTQGKYYWTITEEMFEAANSSFVTEDKGTNNESGDGYFAANNIYYWRNNNSSTRSNAYFQFLDTATGNDNSTNKSVWGGVGNFKETANGVTYGKIFPRDWNDDDTRAKQGEGFINFNETDYAGYSAPLTIYYDPSNTDLDVVATPIYSDIYVSNGYKDIDSATPSDVSIQINGGTVYSNDEESDANYTDCKYKGEGWTPSKEGTVRHIIVKPRNATVKLTKTVESGYKVSSFLVYNITEDTVKPYKATNTTGTTYTTEIKMGGDDDKEINDSLYIYPIVEKDDADMTVVVNADQLDKNQWGDLIGCYAWYADSTGDANGAYPGQLMVPSDDGETFTAKFPSKKGNKELVGILFSNYVNGSSDSNDLRTWLDQTSVLGTVSTQGQPGSGNIIPTYNIITNGESQYHRTNFKCQTYDYREPVAMYANKDTGLTSFRMTFSLKSGNSTDVISLRHNELINATVPGTITHKNSSNVESQITLSESNFEYLTGPDGKHYVDLNGASITGKPTASYYVVAKGMVNYNTSREMDRVFYSSTNYDSVTGVTYPNTGSAASADVKQEFAVQWYVYDAAGNYITNMLSAGFADRTTLRGSTSLIAENLDNLGYAVEGRTVAICYDTPRFCYDDDNGMANRGSNFNAYRFTGQWKVQSEYEKAKVYAKIGMKTDSGDFNIEDKTVTGYGSASFAIDANKLKNRDAQYHGIDEDEDNPDLKYGYTTVSDGQSGALTITASSTNFIGWYYKVGDEYKLATTDTELTPNYQNNTTYYAIYKGSAIYKYIYLGRESVLGDESTYKSYSVSGGNLTPEEMANGNIVSASRGNFGTNAPDSSKFSIFKKRISFENDNSKITDAMLDNDEAYYMKIKNATVTDESFSLTYYYPDSRGSNTKTSVETEQTYNTVVDLASLKVSSLAPSGQRFLGWYEADASGNPTDKLLSTQPNYGQVIVKDTIIAAKYGANAISHSNGWEIRIDDQAVTNELTSDKSGLCYNDVILCARNNNYTQTELPSGGKIGALVVIADDPSINATINTAKLETYASRLAENGASGHLSTGLTVTNLVTTSINNFGRIDLALRSNYEKVKGCKYYIYGYVFDGENYHFDTVFDNTSQAYKTGTYPAYE